MSSEPTTELFVYPVPTAETPVEGDGVLFVVTGPVRPTGVIVVSDSEDVVHATSPEFGQKNRHPVGNGTYSVASTATGGTFYLYGDDGTDNFPQTEDISVVATAATVQAAIRALWGQQSVIATGGPLGTAPVVLSMMDNMRAKPLTVAVNDDAATGGTVVITETLEGGTEVPTAAGPYAFGPIQLPAGATGAGGAYSADVLIASGPTGATGVGSSLLSATTDFYVYPYSD